MHVAVPITLSLLTTVAAAQGKRQVMALPVFPVLERGDTKITVDGSLHEWPTTLPALDLSSPLQLSGTANKAWRGPSDFSARGGMVWDEARLWFFFLVMDDWGRPLRAGKLAPTPLLLPPGDSLVLYFDPKRDTRAYGPDPGRAEDREYWIGMTSTGGTLCVACRRRFATATRSTKADVRTLYDPKKRIYTIEGSIPWSELLGKDAVLKRGMACDLQIILNDFDAPTDPLPQTRIGWTFGTGPRISPAVYGTIVLEGAKWASREPPKRPAAPEPKLTGAQPDRKFWIGLAKELGVQKPVAGSAVLAGRSGELLRSLDTQLAKYPLTDWQEVLMLVQRAMPREVAGYLENGGPLFFDLVMREVLREFDAKYDGPRPSITALPGRGWLVRSKEGSLTIGAAGLHAQRLAPGLVAALIARAQDPLDRHDQLALRVLANKKPVLAHVSFHLPGYGPLRQKNLVNPGNVMKLAGGIEIKVLGKRDTTGRVTPTAGYELTWPSGFTLVYPSLSALPEQVVLPESKRVDVMILDPDHQAADRLIKALKPKITILEGFFDCPRWAPNRLPRNHRLGEAKALIERFGKLGTKVVLLAPGATWS